jgi:hypothetical protein
VVANEYDKMSDDELTRRASAESEAHSLKARHRKELYDAAIRRRDQGWWYFGGVFIAPFVALPFLLGQTPNSLIYVALGVGWACLFVWLLRLERSHLADVETRLADCEEVQRLETPAGDELHRQHMKESEAKYLAALAEQKAKRETNLYSK